MRLIGIFFIFLVFQSRSFCENLTDLEKRKLDAEGLKFYKQQNYQEAITTFEKLMKDDVTVCDNYLMISYSYDSLAKYSEGIDILNKSMPYCKDNQFLYLSLGNLYKHSGNIPYAIKNFENTIKINSKNSDALENLYILEEKQGNIKKSKKYKDFLDEIKY